MFPVTSIEVLRRNLLEELEEGKSKSDPQSQEDRPAARKRVKVEGAGTIRDAMDSLLENL